MCELHAYVCLQEENSLETSGRGDGNEVPEEERMYVVCGPDGFECGLGYGLGTGLSSGPCLPLGGGGRLCPVPSSPWYYQSAALGYRRAWGKECASLQVIHLSSQRQDPGCLLS